MLPLNKERCTETQRGGGGTLSSSKHLDSWRVRERSGSLEYLKH